MESRQRITRAKISIHVRAANAEVMRISWKNKNKISIQNMIGKSHIKWLNQNMEDTNLIYS